MENRMELRHLQHFLAVAEEQSFTRAAQRVHIVQSALSTSIRALEEDLRSRLFVRGTRQVRLTPAGRAFLATAREALRVIDAGRETIADIEGLRSGTLSLGTVHSLPAFLDLPSLIARFHAINPGIEVRLRQGDAAGLLEQLQNGRLDLAFLPLLDPPDGIVTAVIACEDMVVATTADHPIAGHHSVPLRDLLAYPFVDFEIGWGTRPLIDRAFAQAGIQRRTAFDVTDIETLIDLIGQGLGIALLPRTLAEMRAPGIAVAGLIEPEICWELVVAHLRCDGADPVNGAARAFLDLLEVQ
jgi:DNA-binding transcriptional LysR family regulator